MSIDETTDVLGRYVVNVIVGVLSSDANENKIFLLDTVFVDRANHSSIAQVFDDALRIISEVPRNNVLLFVSDVAPYMVKAGRTLKVMYPNMIHLTCLAHGLNRLCEYIRILHPLIDSFIANLKKTFLKSPSRVETFRRVAPGLVLPPKTSSYPLGYLVDYM